MFGPTVFHRGLLPGSTCSSCWAGCSHRGWRPESTQCFWSDYVGVRLAAGSSTGPNNGGSRELDPRCCWLSMGGRGAAPSPRPAATIAAATFSARRYSPRRTTRRGCGCRRGLVQERVELQVAERVACCQRLSCMTAVVSIHVGLSAPRTIPSTGAGFTSTAAPLHICPQRIPSSPFFLSY